MFRFLGNAQRLFAASQSLLGQLRSLRNRRKLKFDLANVPQGLVRQKSHALLAYRLILQKLQAQIDVGAHLLEIWQTSEGAQPACGKFGQAIVEIEQERVLYR